MRDRMDESTSRESTAMAGVRSTWILSMLVASVCCSTPQSVNAAAFSYHVGSYLRSRELPNHLASAARPCPFDCKPRRKCFRLSKRLYGWCGFDIFEISAAAAAADQRWRSRNRRQRNGTLLSPTALRAMSSQDLKLRKRRKGSTATDPVDYEASTVAEDAEEVPFVIGDDDGDGDGDGETAGNADVVNKKSNDGEEENDGGVDGDDGDGDEEDRDRRDSFDRLAETSGLVRLQRAAARALEDREALGERRGGASAGATGVRDSSLPPPGWTTTPGQASVSGWGPPRWGGTGVGNAVGGVGGGGSRGESDGDKNDPPQGSLRRLNRNIDRRLQALASGASFATAAASGSVTSHSHRRASFDDFEDGGESGLGEMARGRTPVSVAVPPVRDSMSSLLQYNHVKGDWTKHASASTFNVAVVFGKRLVRDQITVEYASRIRTLARLFKEEPLFRPSLVCFCGGVGPGNHVSDADAGYIFFRHMCEAQGINLEGVSVFIDSDPASNHEGIALQHVTNEVRNKYLGEWLEKIPAEGTIQGGSDFGGRFGGGIPRKRKKVAVHFSLVSTEYHLCNLNDIHHRSPRQSLLKPIEELKEAGAADAPFTGPYGRMVDSSVSVEWDNDGTTYIRDDRRWDDDDIVVDDDYRDFGRTYRRSLSSEKRPKSPPRIQGVVETSWSFQYATYPFLYAKDEAVVYLGKCFLLGEELAPLLANMKGVVDQKEFFQRDNYLLLVSIRRTLVSHVERLHSKRTSLKIALREYSAGKRDVAAVLEGALLSLGRCLDVVRPAGLLVSSVSKSEWTRALGQLRHSMEEIHVACDPDRPLRPTEWGKLVDDEASTPDLGTDSGSRQKISFQSVVVAAAAVAAARADTKSDNLDMFADE